MPPQTRALWISASASENLLKLRITPGSVSESTEKDVFLPKNRPSTTTAAPLTVEWPEG
jgi:hypothetical protein